LLAWSALLTASYLPAAETPAKQVEQVKLIVKE